MAIRRLSRRAAIPTSRLLMPVGFAAILGGTITLVGSSPLIMLNDLIRPFNLDPFSLFSVTPAGIALVAVGIAYFVALGRFLLPAKPTEGSTEATKQDPLEFYPEIGSLFELRYPRGAGPSYSVVDLCDAHNVHTVALSLDGGRSKLIPPDRDMTISPGLVFAGKFALGCFALATALVIFTRLPLSVCLMAGAVGMVLTGVLTIDEAYCGIGIRDYLFGTWWTPSSGIGV